MAEQKIYFIVPALYPNAGGLTKAMYDKASFLAEHYSVEILTTGFQLYLEKIKDELVEQGKLSPKVIVRNMLVDLSEKDPKNKPVARFDYEDLVENYESLHAQHVDNWIKVFGETGTYQNFISFYGPDIHFIDYMDEYQPTLLRKRYSFYQGNLLALDMMDGGQKTQQIIYNRNKTPILNTFHQNNQPQTVFNLRKDEVSVFTPEGIITLWIRETIRPNDIVLVDCFYPQVTQYLKGLDCTTIGFIHNHQNYDRDSKFVTTFSDFDRFVFLTHEQQEDFKTLNPEVFAKSAVLPHPVRKTKERGAKEKKIVTVSRLVSNQKAIEPGIRAFAKIADRYPDYTYEIYGQGPEEANIRQLIAELGMQNRIVLKGYTSDPLQEFEKAQCSINLTNYEGYGLSIIESLGMSCPVITSRAKYGPMELVKDGETGFIVDHHDIDAVADAIAQVLDAPEKFQDACLGSLVGKDVGAWEHHLLEIIAEALAGRQH